MCNEFRPCDSTEYKFQMSMEKENLNVLSEVSNLTFNQTVEKFNFAKHAAGCQRLLTFGIDTNHMVDEILHETLKCPCCSCRIFTDSRPHIGFERKIVEREVADNRRSSVQLGIVESAEKIVHSFHAQAGVLSHHNASSVVWANGEEELRRAAIGNEAFDPAPVFLSFTV